MSVRQIARRRGHGRDTVKKALVEATPRGYTRTRPVTCPKLGAFTVVIDQILAADRAAPKKQRHTVHRIFQRLRDEHGYTDGYDQVRRYISIHCKRERETHLPRIEFPPHQQLALPALAQLAPQQRRGITLSVIGATWRAVRRERYGR